MGDAGIENSNPLLKNMYTVQCTEDILRELSPLIREEDYVAARRIAQESELTAVIQYLKDNVPDVQRYLSSVPEEASAEEKMAVIKSGLKKRAEGLVPSYSMPPPFLGNDVEEARSKRSSYRGSIVTPYIEQRVNKGSIARRNPVKKNKPARIQFL